MTNFLRLTALIVCLAWLAPPSISPAQIIPPAAGQIQATEEDGLAARLKLLRDPFRPKPAAESLKISYEINGRLEGEAELLIQGERRIYRLKAIDHAYGLEREVERVTITSGGLITTYDLISGQVDRRPDIRGLLSLVWQAYDPKSRYMIAKNATAYGLALSRPLGGGRTKVQEVELLGLPTVKIQLKGRQVWYWDDTDIILKESVDVLGQAWTRVAVDVVTGGAIDEKAFEAPLEMAGPAEYPDLERVRETVDKIAAVLARPIVKRAIPELRAKANQKAFKAAWAGDRQDEPVDSARAAISVVTSAAGASASKDSGTRTGMSQPEKADPVRAAATAPNGGKSGGRQATALSPSLMDPDPEELNRMRSVPWPSVPPPSFRTKAARFRVSPGWKPYPAPPWSRPLPAPGLVADVLNTRAKALAIAILGPEAIGKF